MAFSSNTPAQRWVWWAWIVVAAAACAYGIPSGHVTDSEASLLLQTSQTLSEWNAAGDSRPGGAVDSSAYASLLAMGHWALGVEVSEVNVRLASLVGLLLCAAVVDVMVRRSVGEQGSYVAVLGIICTPAAVWLSHQGAADGLIAGTLLGAVACALGSWRAGRENHGLLACVSLGGAAALTTAAYLLASDGATAAWASRPNDWLVVPFYVGVFALPSLIAAVPSCRIPFWSVASRRELELFICGLWLGLLGMGLSLLAPVHWLAGSLLLAAASAITAAVCWSRWIHGALDQSTRRLHRRVVRFVTIAAPLTAALLGTVRIAVTYNFMERVQALVVVALISAAVGALLLRTRHYVLYWAPLVALLAVGKFVFVHVHLLERDKWESPRPVSRALAQHLPAGGRLWTNLPVTPAFEYYLNAPVGRYSPADAVMARRVDRLLLTADVQPASSPSRWRLVRRLHDGRGRTLNLWRPSDSPLVRSDRDHAVR